MMVRRARRGEGRFGFIKPSAHLPAVLIIQSIKYNGRRMVKSQIAYMREVKRRRNCALDGRRQFAKIYIYFSVRSARRNLSLSHFVLEEGMGEGGCCTTGIECVVVVVVDLMVCV